MTDHIAIEGERLDQIAWRALGDAHLVPAILAANPGLAAGPAELPAGRRIVLPPRPAPAARPARPLRLWGRAP